MEGKGRLHVKEDTKRIRRKKGAYMYVKEEGACTVYKKEGGRWEHMCERRGSLYSIV